jgi:DNA-binding LacI/PurR family transcriptional regulator
VGTVSNVVSGARNRRHEMREQVERAIAELGFRPNTIARALIRRRTQTVRRRA